jgi:hypothetical protein
MATGRVQGGLTKNPPRPKMLTGENPHLHPSVENCTPHPTGHPAGFGCPRILTGHQPSSVRGFQGGFWVAAGFRTLNCGTWTITGAQWGPAGAD